MQNVISLKNVSKKFGTIIALDDLSLFVTKGEIVGLLGPNGAGKSTLMRLMTTFLDPDSGEIEICGFSSRDFPLKIKEHIGYLAESNPLYIDRMVNDYLEFCAKVHGIKNENIEKRIREVCDLCGLHDKRGVIISTLSKGYRQRVGLAQAILHKPKLLILDEPMSGLDPNQILEVRELIQNLAKEQTIILSTHILSEVVKTCSRAIIIDKGKVIFDDKPNSIETLETQFYKLIG